MTHGFRRGMFYGASRTTPWLSGQNYVIALFDKPAGPATCWCDELLFVYLPPPSPPSAPPLPVRNNRRQVGKCFLLLGTCFSHKILCLFIFSQDFVIYQLVSTNTEVKISFRNLYFERPGNCRTKIPTYLENCKLEICGYKYNIFICFDTYTNIDMFCYIQL